MTVKAYKAKIVIPFIERLKKVLRSVVSHFKDNKTIYIMERDLYDNDKPIEYLVEIDISGVHTSDVNSEQPGQ